MGRMHPARWIWLFGYAGVIAVLAGGALHGQNPPATPAGAPRAARGAAPAPAVAEGTELPVTKIPVPGEAAEG
jgi:hypothetical protein